MEKKEILESILKLLEEETKRIKRKKKNKSLISTPILKRPMGSMFYMDAGVSMAESMNESRSIIKPIVKKFDHLKWKLNDYQKQFLDDFINIPDDNLKEKDFDYVSKRTGIPVASIKSIKNTYTEKKTPEEIKNENIRIQKELGIGGGMLDDKVIDDANAEFTSIRELPTDKSGKLWSMNPKPEFRNKSFNQIKYEGEMGAEAGGGLGKTGERKLPAFMFEWLLYFLEGSEKNKITESKLLNDFHSNKFDNYKFVMLSIDSSIKKSGAHPYDTASSNVLKESEDIESKLREFNEIFGTNFIISNQYIGADGFLKVLIENEQLTDGIKVYNKKIINMRDTDIPKAISLGYYDQFTTIRSIT